MKAEDVKVTVDNDVLTIRGERKEEKERKQDDNYVRESSRGTFLRRLPLPRGVKAEDVKARVRDGVLEVRMPRGKEAAPRQIRVQAG